VAAPALPPVDPDAIDPARIPLVLDDPRLAAVKAEADQEAYARAAAALASAIASASPSPEDRRAWLYQLGHLRALGGDPAGAAKAFEDSAAAEWALSDHARVQAAEWRVGVGQFDAAIADVKGLGADHALAGAVELVLADAHLGKNDFAGASRYFRAYLAREKRGASWVPVALRYATALLNHPKEAHAEEAVRLARRVMWEAPGGQGAGAAKDIEKQALETLPSKRRKALEHLSAEEMVQKAHGLVASGQPREAVLVTDKLIKLAKLKHAGELSCEAWLVRGEGLVKMKKRQPEAADAYKGAIEHCAGQPRHPDALFAGGKASASAGRETEAMERYALLERDHPTHRFADDARVRGAHAALVSGDEARFVRMLETIADAYPEGDVSNDGLFELALHHADQKDWARAVPVLEKALARAPRERAYWAAGRLPYFLARAHLETGQVPLVEKALAELAGVVRDYPLSYYMALAYARLADHDRAAAEKALADASREPEGVFTLKRGPWLDDPGFVRARELLRQGDVKLARVELDRIGFSTHTAPREVEWTAAFLLARLGAFAQSHYLLRVPVSVARPRDNDLTDWLEHYPSGRWRAAWEIAYPRPYAAVVAAEAPRQSLPEAWAYAIMREESAFEARVVSHADAIGLMQLIVPTAKKMGEKLGIVPDSESLKQPSVNISLGCRYLSVLRGHFPDNPFLAIPSYNAGLGNPRKWIDKRPTDDFDVWVEHIPFEETRNYTKRVMGSMAAYEFLYFRDKPSEALHTPLAASSLARAQLDAAAKARP
jgi:soluble lytic murein transglycosylase